MNAPSRELLASLDASWIEAGGIYQCRPPQLLQSLTAPMGVDGLGLWRQLIATGLVERVGGGWRLDKLKAAVDEQR